MKLRNRNISVHRLPEILDRKQRKIFYRKLDTCINTDRPHVVFDCSALHELDVPAIHFMLCCLEEAMKRNGDIRLAGLNRYAKARLEAAGVGGIFDVFDTVDEAIESYRRPRAEVALHDSLLVGSGGASENAA
jgi:anti-anti-sigma regulatory factor